MKKRIGLLLLVVLAPWLVTPATAVEFFDINSPSIKKAELDISATQTSTQNATAVSTLKDMLDRSLLFDVVDGKSGFSLTIDGTVESGQAIFTLSDNTAGSEFKPIAFGVRFSSQDPDYLRRKTAQVGNKLLRDLFGLRGALGSTIVWATQDPGESVKSLRIGVFGMGEHKQLTYNLFSNAGVSWNPGRDGIVYTSHTDRGTQVMVQQTNPLRAKSISICESEGRSSAAFWAPDGTMFVSQFISNSNTDIYQYAVEGNPFEDGRLKQLKRITSDRNVETEPSVSSDGRRLAYISDRTGQPQVYVMDLSTNKAERVSKVGGYNASPTWSPDGRYLAYFGIRSGQSSIYRLDMQSGQERRVTPQTLKAEQPRWSPDGSLIVFTGEERGTKKIYYTLSSGGGVRRLTNSAAGVEESDAAWGPAQK